LLTAISDEVRQFSSHEQYDDITLIVAKWQSRGRIDCIAVTLNKGEPRVEVPVASPSIPADGAKKGQAVASRRVVEQHIRLENDHDLEGVLRTFGDSARYDDEAWGEHYKGGNEVRLFYEQLLKALPTWKSRYSAAMSQTTPFSLKS